jgi:hypothetical protein
MISTLVHPEFRQGDEVVLAVGTYQGTVGVFLRLREDVNWADITESNGAIRSHPVAWLAPGCGSRAAD